MFNGEARRGRATMTLRRLTARVATASLVLGGAGVGVVAMAGIAEAHNPVVSSTCSTLSVDLTYYQAPHNGDATPNHVTVKVNGATKADVGFGTTYTQTFDYADPFVSNSYDVQVTAWDDPVVDNDGNGAAGWTHHYTGTTQGCPTTLAHPTKPSVTQTQCDGSKAVDGSYTIPSIEGVVYRVGGDVVAAGTYPASPGSSVHVTAEPAHGYSFGADDVTSWTLDFDSPDCNTVVTPVAPDFTAAPCTGPGQNGNGTITVTPVTGIDYTVDGTPVSTSISEPPGTYHVVATAQDGYEISGTHEWDVKIPQPDCTVVAHPVAPSVQQTSCDGTEVIAPTYTIPDTTGVDYYVDDAGTPTAAGTYPGTPGGTVTVHAVAQDGYTLGDAQDTFEITFDDLSCVAPQQPTVTQAECSGPGESTDAFISIPSTEGVVYEIDGTVAAAGDHTEAPGTYTVTAVPAPHVQLVGDTEWQLVVDATPDCITDVTPVTPTLDNARCAGDTLVPPTYTIPDTTGVDYLVGDQVVPAGSYPATGGSTVIVTAMPTAGHAFAEGTTTQWELTFKKLPTCVLGEKITKHPHHVRKPTVQPQVLPFTGAPTGLMVLLGLATLAAGAALAVVGRRRVTGAPQGR